ncbi:MAG: four helix bundle protein [Candidatus Pacebacteria bacterium]|nr:four helix bundle protein [Candidatus Paceibacterota bacterium]MBP9780682.1 four helix bundle protein [Candidatus Paceibacterota bacterium]
MQINSFKDLYVWQKSMELAKLCYLVANSLPNHEVYGLGSQLRRSAISIPSNIAEGHKRGTKDFLRFLLISFGSAAELETQLLLLKEIYPDISVEKEMELVQEIEKMISVLIKKLKQKL